MRIVDLSSHHQHCPPVRIAIRSKCYAGYELLEDGEPVLTYNVTIRRPILNHIPQSEEPQQLEAGIRQFYFRVFRFVPEDWITDTQRKRDVVLLILDAIAIDHLQTLAQRYAEESGIANPVHIGLQLQSCRIKRRAVGTLVDGSKRIDPIDENCVQVVMALRTEHAGHDTEEIVVPAALAGGYCGMVVLQKSPNLRQRRKMIHLDRRQPF